MTPAEVMAEHAEITEKLCGLYEALAILDAHIETVWCNAYLRSQQGSASGRENDARAATVTFRAEAIRLRGEIASAEARERLLARSLEAALSTWRTHYDRNAGAVDTSGAVDSGG